MEKHVADLLMRKFGACPRCMRTALLLALGSWLMTFLAYSQVPRLALALVALSCLLSANWATHVVVYAIKVVRGKLVCDDDLRAKHLERRALVRAAAGVIGALSISWPVARFAKANVADCPDDGYKSSRTGYGACGAECRTARGDRQPCGRGYRPVFRTDGGCNCCRFSECS